MNCQNCDCEIGQGQAVMVEDSGAWLCEQCAGEDNCSCADED